MLLDPKRYMATADAAGRLLLLAQDVGKALRGWRLGDLANVDGTTIPTNGQALVYNSTRRKWGPGTVGGGGSLASAFRAYKSANYSSGANEFTLVYDTEEYDKAGEYSTISGEFTPTTTGLYAISAGSLCSSALGATDYVSLALIWNDGGGGTLVGVIAQNLNINFTNSTTVGTAMFYLTAGRSYYVHHYCSGHPWTFAGGATSLWFAGAGPF